MGSEIIIVPAAFFTVGWIVHTIVEGYRRSQRLKVFTEFHGKLLDRIGSAREFGDFFNSDAGTRFLDSLSEESGAPQSRIQRSLQNGLVGLSLGLGVFLLMSQRTFSIDMADSLALIATSATAVGAGLMISALMSLALSKRLGLTPTHRLRRDIDPTQST